MYEGTTNMAKRNHLLRLLRRARALLLTYSLTPSSVSARWVSCLVTFDGSFAKLIHHFRRVTHYTSALRLGTLLGVRAGAAREG